MIVQFQIMCWLKTHTHTQNTFRYFRCRAQQTIDFYAKTDNNEKFIHTHHTRQVETSQVNVLSTYPAFRTETKVKQQRRRRQQQHQQQKMISLLLFGTLRNYYHVYCLRVSSSINYYWWLVSIFSRFPLYISVLVWMDRARVSFSFLHSTLPQTLLLVPSHFVNKSNQNNANVVVSCAFFVFVFRFIDLWVFFTTLRWLPSRATDFYSFSSTDSACSYLSLVELGHFELWQVRYFFSANCCCWHCRLMCSTIWIEDKPDAIKAIPNSWRKELGFFSFFKRHLNSPIN